MKFIRIHMGVEQLPASLATRGSSPPISTPRVAPFAQNPNTTVWGVEQLPTALAALASLERHSRNCLRNSFVFRPLCGSTPSFADKRKDPCVCMGLSFYWWRWGESNPRPKTIHFHFLRAQSLIKVSPQVTCSDTQVHRLFLLYYSIRLEKYRILRPQQGLGHGFSAAETRPRGDAAYAANANLLFAFVFK